MSDELITLTMKEQTRYEVIRDNLRRRIKAKEASIMLGISTRQVYRLKKRIKEEGVKGTIHRLRGRPSSKKIPQYIRDEIKRLYKEKYSGFNISHFTEYLNEEENIKVSREYVRKLLRGEGIYPRKPKKTAQTQNKKRTYASGRITFSVRYLRTFLA